MAGDTFRSVLAPKPLNYGRLGDFRSFINETKFKSGRKWHMSLDKATVAGIAHLARIRVADDQLDGLAGELNAILDWIKQLSEVDTDGVAPMTSVVKMDIPLREDKVTDGGYRDRVLANAPNTAEGFFVVPKVIE
jgi:aspartyl-tRNA(Asn)/glutamyl-tRNA(Gln) amidotransferase subunit C